MYVFLHALCVFRFPYFDHDAFMHHTMHVLDAPGYVQFVISKTYANNYVYLLVDDRVNS